MGETWQERAWDGVGVIPDPRAGWTKRGLREVVSFERRAVLDIRRQVQQYSRDHGLDVRVYEPPAGGRSEVVDPSQRSI